MSQDTTFGAASGSRGVNDASDIVFLAHNEVRRTLAFEVLPTKGAREIRAQRGFCNEDDFGSDVLKPGICHDRAPEVVFDNQNFGFRVREELQMFGSRELIVERNHHAAAVENGICGNQPLRLISHDDGGAIVRIEIGILQCSGERKGNFLEIGVGQAEFFAVALGFDETHFFGEAVESITKGRAEACVLTEIEHAKLLILDCRVQIEQPSDPAGAAFPAVQPCGVIPRICFFSDVISSVVRNLYLRQCRLGRDASTLRLCSGQAPNEFASRSRSALSMTDWMRPSFLQHGYSRI